MKRPSNQPVSLEDLFDALQNHARRQQLRLNLVGKGVALTGPVLERLFAKPIESDGSMVKTAPTLTAEDLRDLFELRTSGLHIPGFCPPELADELGRWLTTKCQLGSFHVYDGTELKPSDVLHALGIPRNEGTLSGSKETFLRFYREAIPSMRRLRDACAPQMSPVDRLRLELDESWPFGAQVDHTGGHKLFVGVGRVMSPRTLYQGATHDDGICHMDHMPPVSPRAGMFSANVYLRVPSEGGELDVWPVAPNWWQALTRYSVYRLFEQYGPKYQMELRRRLPPPITVRPRAGDLILINTGRPHAVRGFTAGDRVTLQCFMTYAAQKPLRLYS